MSPEFAAALRLAEGLDPTPANLDRIARATSPEGARWAFAQWSLRHRARARFGDLARDRFWDADGLAMATHPALAAYHASLFPPGAIVADLTCGLGSDLAALAARGPARGYERDPARAALARLNVPAAEVIGGDGLDEVDARYLFADPARRDGVRRLDDPDAWSPDPRALADRMRRADGGAIKLSPGTPDEYLRGLGGDTEFLSFGGECREALVRFPGEGRVSAVLLPTGERLSPAPPPPPGEPEGWLFDLDPAAVRAGASGAFGLAGLGDRPGYLVAPERRESPWWRAYEILWHGRPDDAPREAKRRGWRVFEAKQRGAGADGPSLLRRFPKDGEAASLVLWTEGPRVRAAIVRSSS